MYDASAEIVADNGIPVGVLTEYDASAGSVMEYGAPAEILAKFAFFTSKINAIVLWFGVVHCLNAPNWKNALSRYSRLE